MAYTRGDPQDRSGDRAIPRFFIKPMKNNFRSQAEGREIWEDKEYVEIIVPGETKNIAERAVRDEDRDRWPSQYARFKESREAPETGTPLEEWAAVSASMVMELKSHRIRTVEHVAGLSDSQLAKCIPMGGHALRERAQRFIDQASAEQPIAELTQQVETLKAQLQALQERKEPTDA